MNAGKKVKAGIGVVTLEEFGARVVEGVVTTSAGITWKQMACPKLVGTRLLGRNIVNNSDLKNNSKYILIYTLQYDLFQIEQCV